MPHNSVATNRLGQPLPGVWPALYLVGVILCLWIANLLAPNYFPSLTGVGSEIADGLFNHRYLSLRSKQGWIDAFLATVHPTLLAIIVGGVAGLIIALVLWPSRSARERFRHAVDFLRAVPPL